MKTEGAVFNSLVNLAAEKFGAKVLEANDEFFAEKENLIKEGRGVFLPEEFTDRGKWMDGWETRRKREFGHDWCIIRLGARGTISAVDVDTNHFLGNNPQFASIDVCDLSQEPNDWDSVDWNTILLMSALKPGSQNLFTVQNNESWTHLRLNIYPDGGVARLKVYGKPSPKSSSEILDYASVLNGGSAVVCSDMFFGNMNNLLMPYTAENMGDGWETKRRRGAGNDWVIVQLGKPVKITKIELDTKHFKGNYPDYCTIEAINAQGKDPYIISIEKEGWSQLCNNLKLEADTLHVFDNLDNVNTTYTHVRLNIFPDGGVSRFRVFGKAEE